MGFQIQICSILRFPWPIFVVMCSSANELQQNSNVSFREEYIPQMLTVYYRFITFTFDLCSLLSFVCHI